MMLRVISLGAGVQSTTMALMAAHGEITPMPDVAIFADTGWEPRSVYEHLAWLKSPNVLPYPIRTVQLRSIRDDILSVRDGAPGNVPAIPWFTISKTGKRGRRLRQCTERYKIQGIIRETRAALGVSRRARIKPDSVEMWMGISTDEAVRAVQSSRRYIVNRHPLLDAGMSRAQCLEWLERNGYPRAPKSACIGCPFHNNEMWRDMRDNDPASWAEAVQIDRALRSGGNGLHRNTPYMHDQRVPLDEADLGVPDGVNHFNNECKGMCGV